MTRKEVSDRIDAMINRRSGYKDSKKEASIKLTESQEEKINRAIQKRLNK